MGQVSIIREFQLVLYLVLLQFELAVFHRVSDLNPGTSNWIEKANEILQFKIPADNFYGPGSAILLAPFVFIGTSTYLANHFYFALATIAYWNICQVIPTKIGKTISLLSLPTNVYLIWLIDSSQDTVFEFFLLSWSVYFLSKKRYKLFSVTGFFLCETRAGYWVFYLGISMILFSNSYLKFRKLDFSKLFAVYFLIGSSFFNVVNYGSASPALEGGLTAYFSYTKYHYLSLPKMDMDVFLSGPNGAFSSGNGPQIPDKSTPAEANKIYQKAAVKSILNNKKETLLGWMQKFDSYFFNVQKIPNLPGKYVLDQNKKIISIGEERLSWMIVLGNLLFMIWRSIFLVSGLIAVGLLISFLFLGKSFLIRQLMLLPLAAPYFFGAIPGILIYTETRFKIVSEILLVPLVVEVWCKALKVKKQFKN